MNAENGRRAGENGGDVPPDLVRAAVSDEFDKVVPHLVAALKRDRAFDELTERLSRAERRLAARRERPVAVDLHGFLNRLRHLEIEPAIRQSLEDELVAILHRAGFDELGQVGDRFDAGSHDALEGRTVDGAGTVAEVFAPGLRSFDDVVVRAQVRVRGTVDPADDLR